MYEPTLSGAQRRRSRHRTRAGLAAGLAAVGVLALASPAPAQTPPTLVNGSFETPNLGPSPTSFIAPSTGITGWTVVSGTVDIQDEAFGNPNQPDAFDGEQFVDLAGGPSGVLQQTIPTVAGTGYVVSWNFGVTFTGSCGAATKTGTFSVQGAAVENMSATTVTGSGDANWQSRSTTFTGTGGPVTLQFADTTPGPGPNCGLAIDNVVLAVDATVPVVEPVVAAAAAGTVAVAGAGYFLMRRRRSDDTLLGGVAAG